MVAIAMRVCVYARDLFFAMATIANRRARRGHEAVGVKRRVDGLALVDAACTVGGAESEMRRWPSYSDLVSAARVSHKDASALHRCLTQRCRRTKRLGESSF